ncbi:PRC-barrel domain-containing protein [Rhodopseudomonas palustris]|uniref:PRC-barrel domain-containing protein n=1 Tax=Rhodopseudomonas palustris TaxID=1076 RepID=UPI000CEB8A57|nr:PRC-barrel domain-containing protein [Rhodopseudomonas palustris]PPQ42839.1 photosystem reaction center subunit H [Rhodopseudomonas palustris]
MKANTIIAGLLSSTLLATAAYAQTPAPADSTRTMSKSTSASESQRMGQWRASKLIGVNVYNQGNEKLGDISEMLIDSEGRIQGVVIGVGGFLGVGQRDVAVTFDKLQWVNTPVSSNTAMNSQTTPAGSGTSTASPAGTTTGAATSTTAANNADRWYPDHAVLNATKDQLKSMPEFKYSK